MDPQTMIYHEVDDHVLTFDSAADAEAYALDVDPGADDLATGIVPADDAGPVARPGQVSLFDL